MNDVLENALILAAAAGAGALAYHYKAEIKDLSIKALALTGEGVEASGRWLQELTKEEAKPQA